MIPRKVLGKIQTTEATLGKNISKEQGRSEAIFGPSDPARSKTRDTTWWGGQKAWEKEGKVWATQIWSRLPVPTLGQECRWQGPSLLDWLAAMYRMFCSFPFLFFLLCGPVFLFCFFSPFLFPNHSPGQHKWFIFFFFLFNFASRVSYWAYSLGKRKTFFLLFTSSFPHLPSEHGAECKPECDPTVQIGHRRYLEPGSVLCRLLLIKKLLLGGDVSTILSISASSLHPPWPPWWLQIWHKVPMLPRKELAWSCWKHLPLPTSLSSQLSTESRPKCHPSQSPEVACQLPTFCPTLATFLSTLGPALVRPDPSLWLDRLGLWFIARWQASRERDLRVSFDTVLLTQLTHTHSFLHLKARNRLKDSKMHQIQHAGSQ